MELYRWGEFDNIFLQKDEHVNKREENYENI